MRIAVVVACMFVAMVGAGTAGAQVGVFSKENLIEYTPEWKGERFPDGRPKVPDALLERLKYISVTHAWSILSGDGYPWQYEGNFIPINQGGVLVGRALTAVYMPRRPDVRGVMDAKGVKDGRTGDQIHWPIQALSKGDVYVARCVREDRGRPHPRGQPRHVRLRPIE